MFNSKGESNSLIGRGMVNDFTSRLYQAKGKWYWRLFNWGTQVASGSEAIKDKARAAVSKARKERTVKRIGE